MKRKLWLLAIPAVLCAFAFAAACTQPEETQITEYKVVYMNGDKEFDSFTVKSGDALPTPDGTPERADTAEFGYTFAGWADEKNGTAEDIIDLGTVTSVTSDLTYYAVYSATPFYTVTFEDGLTGQTISEVKVLAGGDATAPAAPEHEGYRFAGWDGDYTDISGRTTVTAVYEKLSYTLTYSVLGSSYTEDFEFGAALDGLAAPAAVPAGLTFIKWQAENAEGELVAVKDAYPYGMPAEDITVTAKFAVDWDWMGVAINTTNAVYGGSASVNLPASTALAFTYKWSDGTTANTYAYKAAGTQQLSVDVTAEYVADGKTLISQTKTFPATAEVAKAELDVSVTVTNANGGVLTYGTVPQVKFEAKGYVNGDEELAQDAFAATYAFGNGNPADGAKLGVGSYTVSAIIDSQNYTANCTPAKIRVAAKNIAVNVTANDITYGEDVLTEVIADKSQFAYGEDISVLAGGKVVIKNADGTEVSGILPAGEYTVELSGYTNTNYKVTLNSAEFTVNKATLTATVSVDKTSYVYGEKPVAGIEYAGFVNEEDEDVIDQSGLTYTFMSGDKTAEKFNVGEYTVTAGGAAAANYIITEYKPATFKVTPATLTATVTVDGSYVYGTAVQTDIAYSGFVNGENEELVVESGVKFTYNNGKENVAGNLPVGNYTVTADGATAANYTITYKGAQFAVTPATITATVNVGASYVFGDKPQVTVDYAGFAYEEGEAVITTKAEITLSGEAVEGYLPVGNYTVTADGAAAANYTFNYVYANRKFTVAAYGVTLGLSVNGVKSGTEWSRTVGNGEVPALPQGFTFTGKLALTNTAQGTYTSNGASLENGFVWAEDYKITFNGKDFTNSFALTYNISVSLTDSDFGEVEENTVNTPYTGNAISLGSVTLTNSQDIAGLKIEYKLAKDGEEAWSETAPTAINAGVYGVEYRLTAPNYKTSPGSFTSNITQAENKITFSGYGTLTYNGETHKFSLEEFKSTFGEVKFAAGSDTEWLNADTYTIKVEVVGTDNYKGDSKEFEVTVNKAANTLTQGSPVENLVFNNTQQYFDISGHFTAANGTPAIVSGDKFGFDAGKYTFTVQVNESENYLASNAIQVTVTIAKATNNVISGDNTLEFTYNGTLQNFLEGNEYTATYGTVMFKDQTSGTNAVNYQFTAYVEETANYNGADMLVTVTINKADYSSVPEKVFKDGYDIIYRQNAHTLSDISGALEAGFYWAENTLDFAAGANSFDVYYCADKANYNPYLVEGVTFTAYYEVVITVGVATPDFEAVLDTQALSEETAYSVLSAVDQDGSPVDFANYSAYISADVDSINNQQIGGTYPVTYKLNKQAAYAAGYSISFADETTYCSEDGSEAYVPFKLKSVTIGDIYYTIEDALATAADGQTIIVAGNTSFADSKVSGIYGDSTTYTLESGVTLLLPYNSGITSADANVADNTKSAQKYADENEATYLKVQLTVPEGITIESFGRISIGAVLGTASAGQSGHTSGDYAQLNLNGNLNLNETAILDCYGYIKGNGKVTANYGAVITMPFVVRDFKGGTYTTGVYMNSDKQAPFNQYEMPNIQTDMRINYGASLKARASLYAGSQHNTTIADMIGHDGKGVIELSSGAYVETSFKAITNRNLYTNDSASGNITAAGYTTVKIYGGAKDNALELEIKLSILNFPVSTEDVFLGIPYNFRFEFYEGTYDINMQYKLLPGSSFVIGENATVNVNNNMIIYSDFQEKLVLEGNNYSYLYPTLVGGEQIDGGKLILSGGTLNVKSGSFGGEVSVEVGSTGTIVFSSGVSLSANSIEATNVSKGFLSIGSVEETQTISENAKLAGYEETPKAGKTYTYGENGWAVS